MDLLRNRTVWLGSALLAALGVWAVPITAPQAQTAVTKWLTERPTAHMEANFTSGVADVETVKADDGTSLFHIVKLEGGGFVVTSADDGVQPIIAFSDSGSIEKSADNPMWAMLNRDLSGRLADARESEALQAGVATNGVALARALQTGVNAAQSEWSDLLTETQDALKADGSNGLSSAPTEALRLGALTGGRSSLSDVRVSPLVQTKWSQSVDSSRSGNCYNLYTPNNYVCGCVATAGAQLMKFWSYPTTSVTPRTFSCFVDESAVSKTMYGGTYAWSSMPLAPSSSMTTAQRQAIGKLCYDAGVASRMNWTSGGSGACPIVLATSLTDVFGYASAKCLVDQSISDVIMRRAIYANLDAGCPVLLGIVGTKISNSSKKIGHAIVADGYGVYNSTVYTHLNMGWAGLEDAWYALPTVYASANDCSFTTVQSVTYNVFPQTTGELITGRVLDAGGAPISGATVTAVNGTTTNRATTNSKGIYAIKVANGDTTWQLTVTATGYEAGSAQVTVSSSKSSRLAKLYSDGSFSFYGGGTVGNSWGNDFTLAVAASDEKPNFAMDKCVLTSDEVEYSAAVGKTAFAVGETIRLYVGWRNNGAVSSTDAFAVRHELLNASGTVLGTWNYDVTAEQRVGYTSYWTGVAWAALQNLAAGTYRYRVSVDVDGDIDETDESDNTATVVFTVAASEAQLTTVTISGSSTLEPGASAQYTCQASLADGTVITTTPVWTLASGSDYASLSSSGLLTAGVQDSARSVIIRATCTHNGVTRSATKTVAIKAALSLPVALDNTALTFATDGDAPWYGQLVTAHDGVDAARSGVIGNKQSSAMETTVTGPGTLSYWYKVSSEANYDKFTCTIGSTVVLTESGTDGGWRQHTIEVNDSYAHTIRWCYTKDVSLSSGDDCVYLDQVCWTPSATLSALVIGGASSVAAGASAQLTCTATMSDGSSKRVTPTWSISSGSAYGSVSAAGVVTAYASTVARSLVVQAQYEEGGIVKTAQKAIQVTAVLPLPDVPVITRSGPGSSSAAMIAWTAATNAATYRVYRSTDWMRPATPLASGLTVRSYSDASAVPGVAYTYWVSAVNATGEVFSAGETAYRMVSLTATPGSLSFGSDASAQTVTVKSNASWSFENVPSWLTFSVSGDVLTIRVAANDSEEPRSSAATITAGGSATYPKSIELVISQNGKPHEETGTPDFAFLPTWSGDARYGLFAASTAAGSAGRRFAMGQPFYLRWGWGNVGTGAIRGGTLSEIQISTPDLELVLFDSVADDVSLDPGEGCAETVTYDELMLLDPGIYVANVYLNVDGRYDELNDENNEAEFRFAVSDEVTLAEALDCTALTFASADWYGTAGLGHDGEDCAMTELLGDSCTNTLAATVSAAGTVTFTYRTSTEAGCDLFRFVVDGETRLSASGRGEWRTVSFEVGEGAHTFQWIYGKDARGLDGDDCVYLDNVVWRVRHSDEPPADFKASDGGYYNSIKLTWTAVEGTTGYVIERADAVAGPWTEVYNGVFKREVSDTDVLGSLTYYYRIKAVFEDGETRWSEIDAGYRDAFISTSSARWLPGTGYADGFNLTANGPWTVSTKADWIILETTRGAGGETCKFNYRVLANPNESSRESSLTFKISSDESGLGRSYTRTVTIYQRAMVKTGGTLSLREAGDTDLVFVTSDEAPWIGQRRISHDGKGSMRSADIGANATSRVETAVGTGGRLGFWWGTSSESYDKLTFSINGVVTNTISGFENSVAGRTNVTNWAYVEVTIPDGGAVLAWEYVKDYISEKGEDAGFIDQITWTPSARTFTPPDAWWDRYPDLLPRLGVTDRSVALTLQSPGSLKSGGKVTPNGQVIKVLDDYIAGTDPLDSDSLFKATIEIIDGEPVVRWSPQLSDSETRLRNYLIFGKKTLADPNWTPVADGHAGEFKFFRTTVELK